NYWKIQVVRADGCSRVGQRCFVMGRPLGYDRRVTGPPPLELAPAPPDGAPAAPTRGLTHPRAMAWFGFRSFWGPLYHLVASVIATEDIDSRDWMRPDPPARLARRIARVLLGAEPPPGALSVAELVGRDLWIDFIADTGDDVSVSEAVARMFAG